MKLADVALRVCPTADEGVIVYQVGDGLWACRYIGITHERAAEILYQMADGIVDQKIPPPDWRERIKGG